MLTEKKLRQIIRHVIVEHEMSIDTLAKPKVSGSNACPDCKGTGVYIPAFGPREQCELCHGTGAASATSMNSQSTQQSSRELRQFARDIVGESIIDLEDTWLIIIEEFVAGKMEISTAADFLYTDIYTFYHDTIESKIGSDDETEQAQVLADELHDAITIELEDQFEESTH